MNKLIVAVFCCFTFAFNTCAEPGKARGNANSTAPPLENSNATANPSRSEETPSDNGVETQGKESGADNRPMKLTPHKIALTGGKSLVLNLPADFDIAVAVEGLKRLRFFAKSPDNRIFLTTMYN